MQPHRIKVDFVVPPESAVLSVLLASFAAETLSLFAFWVLLLEVREDGTLFGAF